MPKLFVALELPHPLIDDIGPVGSALRSSVEDARWQRDEQLHLTLAYIGDVNEALARDIEGELARVPLYPFEMALKGVGQFGKDGRVKSLWGGVSEEAPIVHLHEKVMRALSYTGCPLDQRRFVPHVTLARFRKRAAPPIGPWLNDNETLCTKPGLITHFTLFSSHSTAEGSYYRAEARYGPGAHWHDHVSDDGNDYGFGLDADDSEDDFLSQRPTF